MLAQSALSPEWLLRRTPRNATHFPVRVARINERVKFGLRQLHRRDYAALSQLKGDRLELSSSTAEIRDICEKRGEARAKLGDDAALELARILADVEAFDDFEDFQATFGSQITDRGELEKCFSMKAGYSILFRAGHPRNLGVAPVATDWRRTTRLMITAIEKADA